MRLISETIKAAYLKMQFSRRHPELVTLHDEPTVYVEKQGNTVSLCFDDMDENRSMARYNYLVNGLRSGEFVLSIKVIPVAEAEHG